VVQIPFEGDLSGIFVRPKLATVFLSVLDILTGLGEGEDRGVKSNGGLIFDASIIDLLVQLSSKIFVVHESRTLFLKNAAPFAKFVNVCIPPFGPSFGASATFTEDTSVAKKVV
jgi:hypothetical protein